MRPADSLGILQFGKDRRQGGANGSRHLPPRPPAFQTWPRLLERTATCLDSHIDRRPLGLVLNRTVGQIAVSELSEAGFFTDDEIRVLYGRIVQVEIRSRDLAHIDQRLVLKRQRRRRHGSAGLAVQAVGDGLGVELDGNIAVLIGVVVDLRDARSRPVGDATTGEL